MNCLRFTTRTGLVALVAVLLVGGLMPVVAGAAEDEAGSFDPFALDAMISASLAAADAGVIAPMDERPTVLRTQRLIMAQRSNSLKVRSPFRPGPFGN